jgi:hypothetical protein
MGSPSADRWAYGWQRGGRRARDQRFPNSPHARRNSFSRSGPRKFTNREVAHIHRCWRPLTSRIKRAFGFKEGIEMLKQTLTVGSLLIGGLATISPLVSGSALAQVRILQAEMAGEGPLSSGRPTAFRVLVETSTSSPADLHVYLEEFPPNTACRGDNHQTNGGSEFRVPAGRYVRWYTVVWRANGYSRGLLNPAANLARDDVASASCFPFDHQLAAAPPQRQAPAPPRPRPQPYGNDNEGVAVGH